MGLVRILFGLTKKLGWIILILSIGIPLYYGSTNTRHLRLRLIHSLLSLKYQFQSDPHRTTLSSDYRAFEEIMSMKPLGDLNTNVDPQNLIQTLRSSFSMSNILPKPSTCQIEEEIFEHDGHRVQTYWIDHHRKPIERSKDHLLIYLHGGGYIMGDIQSYAGFECHLSRLFNLTLLHVEYRLSPEHPLPAAVEDTMAMYRSLLKNAYSPSQIFIMGDSAGGGLTLLTIQSILSHQLPVPRGVITLSAWTDLSASGESYQRNRMTDVMFRHAKNGDDSMVKLVLGENFAQLSANHSSFSPLFGSFDGFPPMFVNVGTAEILEDDSRRVVEKAEKSNVSVTFEEGKDLMHVYPVFYLYYPEARKTLTNIQKWIFDLEKRAM